MRTYSIPEDNMEAMEKKLARIERKCSKNHIEFCYNKVGEHYEEVDVDDKHYLVKFYDIEVEGSLRHNGWTFIGSIDHMPQRNVIRVATLDNTIIPEYYFTAPGACDHCNTNRARKYTFLIRNDETGEWKQVGRNCLQEYTNGLSAEDVANFYSYLNAVEDGENCGSGRITNHYFTLVDAVALAKYFIDTEGFKSTRQYESTASQVAVAFFGGFDIDRKYYDYAEACINYYAGIEHSNESYIANLHAIALNDCFNAKQIGFVASMPKAYDRVLAQEEVVKAAQKSNSQFVGEVGERITVEIASTRLVWSGENYYGSSNLIEFVDKDGNVFTWFTSCPFKENATVVTGTIKEHKEYKGVNQTVLTRCKIKE